jgi:hypothetical protein
MDSHSFATQPLLTLIHLTKLNNTINNLNKIINNLKKSTRQPVVRQLVSNKTQPPQYIWQTSCHPPPINLPRDHSRHIRCLLALFATITMTSAIASQPTTPTSCEERTEELVRKIKALSTIASNSKPNSSPESPSTSSSKDLSSLPSYPPVRPATPPSDPRSPPGIEIVYCAKVHPRSHSPPPKSLARTFPCPPEIPFPNETKITSNFVHNTNTRTSANSADPNSAVDAAKPSLTDDAVLSEVETNIVSPFGGRIKCRARRGRGNLWTPPRTTAPTKIIARPTTPLPQTRPMDPITDNDGWDISSIEVKLSQISLSIWDEQKLSKHEYYASIPVWLESLPDKYESGAFHLDSALNHGVSDANHPRLQDQFTTSAFNRFNDKITQFVRNEVDWESLRGKWN